MEWLVLLAIAGIAWFWYDTMRARERAITIGRQLCEREGFQLLDYTVALAALRMRRNSSGHVMLHRKYAFEFSDTGNNRRGGVITLLGHQLEAVQLEPYLMQ